MADVHDADPVLLDWPLRGRFQARNSPARRVPSHGTDLFGTRFAIDLVPVDARGRSAPRSWRALIATERPQGFVGFGAIVSAPCAGRVVLAHDGETDHAARRSPAAASVYLAGQAARARNGPAAVAGNHLVIDAGDGGPYVLVAHLRRGSLRLGVGDTVGEGDAIAACGNSGNSIQPHVHLQATDSIDWAVAQGLPLAFRTPTGPRVPDEAEIISA